MDVVDVALLVARRAGRIRHLRRRQGLGIGQRAGQLLIDSVKAGIKARRNGVAELQPQIGVDSKAAAFGMVAVAVRRIGADGTPCIDRIARNTRRNEPAQHVEAARVGAKINPAGGPSGRRHPVDRTAERSRSKA